METLQEYIESEIIPRYDAVDGAHRRGHVRYLVGENLKLSEHYGLDRDMVYTVAAYHETGFDVVSQDSSSRVRQDSSFRSGIEALVLHELLWEQFGRQFLFVTVLLIP